MDDLNKDYFGDSNLDSGFPTTETKYTPPSSVGGSKSSGDGTDWLAAIVNILPWLSGENVKNRRYTGEQEYKSSLEQWGLGTEQDILEATTRQKQKEALEKYYAENPITSYAYTKPNEEIYRKITELGLSDIREQGQQAQASQAEAMAARGLGASSMNIGASQRLEERVQGSLAELEANYAMQEAQRQMQYEQLMAQEQARVQGVQSERDTLLAGYIGPTSEEVAATAEKYKPVKPEEEYTLWEKLLPGGKGKKGGWGGKWRHTDKWIKKHPGEDIYY